MLFLVQNGVTHESDILEIKRWWCSRWPLVNVGDAPIRSELLREGVAGIAGCR
jgi:hypothetical protein